MSQENVESVRRLFDLLNAGDLDGLAEMVPPDFVLDRSASRSPEHAVYRGPQAIKRLLAALTEVWSEFEFFETEMIDAGDIVIRVGGVHGHGRASGIDMTGEGAAMVVRFRDSEPVSASFHQSKAEALEAAGLSE